VGVITFPTFLTSFPIPSIFFQKLKDIPGDHHGFDGRGNLAILYLKGIPRLTEKSPEMGLQYVSDNGINNNTV